MGDSDSGQELPDGKKAKPEDGQGLDEFLSKYQSEDDASFGEIMEKAEERRRERYAWLYEGEREARLALEAPDQTLAITDGKQEMKAIDQRPASVKTWTYTGRNTLMYFPEGVELSAKEKVEGGVKHREVVHTNTRLSREFVRKTQASLARAGSEGKDGMLSGSKDKVGIDGKVLAPGESPQVDGYGFVATPQIHPGVDASPLMTWGSIEGTPFHLDTDITPMPGPSFKLPKVPRREEIALKLAEKANKANRERKKAAELAASPALLRQRLGTTPSSSERLQLLSPAARKLASRTATPGSTDRALRASYTPRRTPGTTSTDTPARHKPGGSTPSTPSLTDNLLNLSNR